MDKKTFEYECRCRYFDPVKCYNKAANLYIQLTGSTLADALEQLHEWYPDVH